MLTILKNYLFIMVLFGAGWAAARWGSGRELRRLMGPRFAAEFAITIFAGFFAPNIWVYHLVTIAAFLFTVRDREEAICRYAVMIALLPGVTTVLSVGGVYLGTFGGGTALSLAMLIAGASLRDSDRSAQAPRGWRVEDGLVAVVFLTFTLGASRLVSPTVLLRQGLVSATDLLIPYWLFRRHVRSAVELHRVLACIAFSAIPIAVIALYESRRGWPLFEGIASHLSMVTGFTASLMRRGNSLRAQAAFGSPLVLALFFMLAMPAWLCTRRFFIRQQAWLAGVGLLALATIAPQSRGVLLAIVPALIVLLITRRRFAAAAGLLGAAGVGASALFVLQHSSAAVAAFVGGNQTGDYYDYRGLLLHRGLQEGRKHWLTGQPFDAVLASLSDITQGEHIVDFVNTYLTVFLLGGLVAFVPFVLSGLLTLRKLVARAPQGATLQAVRDDRAFLLATLTGLFIYIWSISFIERVEVYFVMLLAMARLCSAQLQRGARPVAVAPAVSATAAAERLVPA